MIEVIGSKTKPQETDPAERYVLKNTDKKSKTLAVLSVFLVGVALYLKSIFPNWADAKEGKPVEEEEPKAEAEPEMAQAESLESPPPGEAPAGTEPEPDGPVGSGGMPVDLIPPATFMTIQSPEVNFLQPEVAFQWNGVGGSALGAMAANDNSGGGTSAPGDGGDLPPDPEDPDPTDPSDPSDPSGGDPCDEDDGPQSGNRAPRVSGPVYLMDVTGCAILSIGLTDLLRNAVDPDGDMLAVQNLTVSSGTLTQSDDGWIFQGGPQLLGPVTVTYQITDGEFTVEQTARFSVVRSYVGGTDGDDTLLGTDCADDIGGGYGDDSIDGRSGDDVISGGCGNDHIVAGDGDDTVFGGDGDDIVFGSAGNDHISGGAGNDRLFGEEGDDIVFGDAGDDFISGGDGDDILSGGEGDDHVAAAPDHADDIYDGGTGCDTLDYSGTTAGVTVDLVSGTASGLEIGEDTISGFEAVKGGDGDDHFIVGDEPAVLVGGEGENMFEFADPPPGSSVVMHEIVDFKVGDLIRMSKYDIFEEVYDGLEDRFEDIYGDDVDDDDVAIRYRNEQTDGTDRTIIEADLDNDDIYETTIALQGSYALVIVENA